MIVGDGEYKQKLMLLTQNLGIEKAVLFTGYEPRAKEIIAALDVLVLPSYRETFGRTLLEAMSVKTPVIATRSGGIPEVITHGYNGLLVDYRDVKSLSRAIICILEDKQLASRLVENGYNVCRERFSLRNHISSLELIYRRMLN